MARSAFRPPALSPAQILAVSLVGLIAAGTLCLWLPWAAGEGREIGLLDAFFTATSAVCVTGLTVVDTPNDFSTAGQVVVMLLIQAGGLGYMAITTIVAFALGKRLTLKERLTLQESLNLQSSEGLVRFTLTVLRMTLAFELTGAAILAAWWWNQFGPKAIYYGLFHSVSAFNNAGFALFSDNLMGFRGDPVVNGVISFLIIAGGLGFVVLHDIRRRLTLGVALPLHTRLVLTFSAFLLAFGTMSILALEWRNAATLGSLPLPERVLAAWFQSVSPRTAGFNTVNLGAMRPATLCLIMALMFVGASPGGTGGGVKTTTFGVTVAALWATVRREDDPVLFRRRLAPDLVARSFFICLIAFLGLNLVGGILLLTDESFAPLAILFETTSAFGTVGLSTGHPESVLSLVGHMSVAGKLLLAGMMFVGRLGPMTLAVALARSRTRAGVRYPEGNVLIG